MRSPEMASLDAFAIYLLEDDRTSFTWEEAHELSRNIRVYARDVIAQLKELGFSLEERKIEKRVRGFTSSSHDRWYGPGADRTFGGSGFDNRE